MRLRFTIRDLLWLAVVVALAVGWWLEHAAFLEQRDREFEKVLESIDKMPMPHVTQMNHR